MNLSKLMKRTAKMVMLTLSAALFFAACAEEVVTNDSVSVSNNMTPASLDAPVIKGTAYDGVNYITWTPVKNATAYRLYRNNQYIDSFDYVTGNPLTGGLSYYDYASLSSTIESIKNGQSYTYTVVATGDQSGRGTNTSTDNTTQFVMGANDILGDSVASITLTAKVPEVFSKVEAAKNVKAKYNGQIVGVYFEKPEYLNATVKFAHKATGVDVDIFSYLTYRGVNQVDPGDPETWLSIAFLEQKNNTYSWTPIPAYGGTYSYQIITSWPDAFYQSNGDASGDVEVPTQEGKNAPELTATDTADSIILTFADPYEASYTLYRAENTAEGAYNFSAIASGDQFDKKECVGANIYYSYEDKTVEFGKKYVYMLTGTVGGKALNFDWKYPAVAFESHSIPFAWNPQFAAIHDGKGTVSLSWNVEDGVKYKVFRCTIDTDDATPTPNVISHVENYLNNGDYITVGTPINGVFVMTDTITKRENSGYYQYTLVGENKSKKKETNTYTIPYNVEPTTFEINRVFGEDTANATNGYNGIKDKVVIKITASNSIDIDNVTFTRAKIGPDNQNTFAGMAEFLSSYETVTLTPDNSRKEVGDKETIYYYIDSIDPSLVNAEEILAENAYSYVATITENGKQRQAKGIYGDSYSDITLPDILYKKDDSDANKDTYRVYWNGEFANTIPTSAETETAAKLTSNAATVTLLYAITNAGSVDDIISSEWKPKAVVKATDFADSTYWSDEISIGDTESAYQYLYIRVLFENAANVGVVDKTGPVYTNHVDLGEGLIKFENKKFDNSETPISSVLSTKALGNTQIKPTSGANVDGCVIKTNGTLDNITVWVTWLNAGGEILAAPTKITNVKAVPDNSDNTTSGYYVDGKKSWYFTDEAPAGTVKDNTEKVLVHVTNTEGKVLRDVVTTKWW